MTTIFRLPLSWACLAVSLCIASWALGRLSASGVPAAPMELEDNLPRVPVITLTREAGAVRASVSAGEARFQAGDEVIVVPPGQSAQIPLP